MGKVILGMPGPWANDYREVADHYTTKIGGLSDWPIPEVDIRPDFLECSACGTRLCLLVQIYAPVSSASLMIEERVIYVFGCKMQKCGDNPLSWRALRIQKVNNEEARSSIEDVVSSGASPAPVSSEKWLEDLGNSGPGDLEEDDFDLEELSRALSEAASLVSHSRKNNSHQKSPAVKKGSPLKSTAKLIDSIIPVLPCFYTYSQEEILSGNTNLVHSNHSSLPTIQKEHTDLDNHKEENWEEEGYEYDTALFVDRTFLKFTKQMDAYPQQCFRYSYNGKPLLASKDIEKPKNCQLCGGFRHYEMQLMPPLLYFLREASDGLSTYCPEHWNWMTLIVYTCSKNCFQAKPEEGLNNNGWIVAEETVIAQFE